MYKKIICASLALIIMLMSCSCGKKAEEEVTDTESEETTVEIPMEELTPSEPENINPLTGLEASYEIKGKRPIAVMLNNIYQALPQVGIGNADILFECIAEGGITRLMGVFGEYNNLDVIGSVRSSRPYYIDFAQMFDAVYCHAGGSEDAYAELSSRRIDHIDGVRGDPLGVYYRDSERLKTMSLEHTMMTTGEGIVKTIEYCGFRTDLREGFEYPFIFAPFGETVSNNGEECKHIYLPISNYQTVDYLYNEEDNLYYRHQYNGEKHIDGATGEQLAFTNIIVLFTTEYPYDDYGRLKVATTGEGDGYFATNGQYVPIKWSRSDREGNLSLTDANSGKTIEINRGKTFINICSSDIKGQCELNNMTRMFK